MDTLFEYRDILNSRYEVFMDSLDYDHKSVTPHWHYFMEIIYVVSGSFEVTIDGKKSVVEEGGIVLFFPRSIHSMEKIENKPTKYFVIKFDINRLNVENSYTPKLSGLFSKAKENESASMVFSKDMLIQYNVRKYFEDCLLESTGENYGYDLIIHGQLMSLLITLVRIWRANGFDTDCAGEILKEENSIYTITEYINEHSSEQIKVEDIAARCNVSYSYFAKEFKKIYGRSCKEYIEFIRVCKVENMLLFTDYDLNYISQEIGFSDSSHLIKTFKKVKNMTPKQYKKLKSGNL